MGAPDDYPDKPDEHRRRGRPSPEQPRSMSSRQPPLLEPGKLRPLPGALSCGSRPQASRKAPQRWVHVPLITAGSILLLGGVSLTLTGCGSSPVSLAAAAPTSSAAAQVTDPNGQTCASLDSSGYCPGDDPSTTDPNGQTCASLDSSGYCPGDDPAPSSAAPSMTKQTDTIVFKVEGSGYPSVQYGTDSSDNNPSGGYGPLGDGNLLPWTASMTYDSSALYYYVSAQLQGSGDISDSVTEVVETWCSDGTNKTESFPLAKGQASGGYGIANAEYTGGGTGNATQAESDAGC